MFEYYTLLFPGVSEVPFKRHLALWLCLLIICQNVSRGIMSWLVYHEIMYWGIFSNCLVFTLVALIGLLEGFRNTAVATTFSKSFLQGFC